MRIHQGGTRKHLCSIVSRIAPFPTGFCFTFSTRPSIRTRAWRSCQILRTNTKRRDSTPLAYIERVNRAIDHIVKHLGEPLRLTEVARAAKLSPFHFHRVFQMIVGETIGEFVKRLRLERALFTMVHARRPSFTSIALDCGFSSSSDFSRCFKQRYGAAPSAFDISGWLDSHRAELEAMAPKSAERLHVDRVPAASNPDGFKVRIRDLAARTVAYIRVRNPYQGDAVAKATQRLISWANRNQLADGQWLGYQWDNPEIVSLADCQYHIAVEAEQFTPRGEIGLFRFPPMTVAQVEVCGGNDLALRALQWLFGSWLPMSRYVPDDHPCFESFVGLPFAHGTEYFELHAQLPVRKI
ncbi:MAG: GyrI-like domain-containing protein [Planctomycetota bacterium]